MAAFSIAQTPINMIEEKLPNGLQVTILPDASHPVVATQLWYHVGAANETPKTRGFAHLFEHLMFGGTTNHDKKEYAEYYRLHGGTYGGYTQMDNTVYMSEIPREGLSAALQMEADRMVNLNLNQQNLDNEKRIVTEELRAGTENSPINRLFVALLQKVFSGHPYAITPIGTKEDIAAATLDLARDFYKRYYRPQNAHLVIVGPVDGPATMEEVRSIFGPISAEDEILAKVPLLSECKTPEKVQLRDDIPPIEAAVIGYLLPESGTSDGHAVLLMNRLLHASNVNPFEEEIVRRKKRALFGGSMQQTYERGSYMLFFSVALPYRREETAFRYIDETMAQLSRMEWLTDESLAAAKRAYLRGEDEVRWYAAQRASRLGPAKDAGGARAVLDLPSKVEAVTRADVAAAFEKYVVHGRPFRVYVRPKHVPLAVNLFGWIFPLVMR